MLYEVSILFEHHELTKLDQNSEFNQNKIFIKNKWAGTRRRPGKISKKIKFENYFPNFSEV